MTSSKVLQGVKFGCACCMELFGLGYSRLKHCTDCPFTLNVVNSNFDDELKVAVDNDPQCLATSLDAFLQIIKLPFYDDENSAFSLLQLPGNNINGTQCSTDLDNSEYDYSLVNINDEVILESDLFPRENECISMDAHAKLETKSFLAHGARTPTTDVMHSTIIGDGDVYHNWSKGNEMMLDDSDELFQPFYQLLSEVIV